jgi:hypothetical protein
MKVMGDWMFWQRFVAFSPCHNHQSQGFDVLHLSHSIIHLFVNPNQVRTRKIKSPSLTQS